MIVGVDGNDYWAVHDGIPILSTGRLLRRSVTREVLAWRMVNGEPSHGSRQKEDVTDNHREPEGSSTSENGIFEEEADVPINMEVDTTWRWKHSSLRIFEGPASLEERRTCNTPLEHKGRAVLR